MKTVTFLESRLKEIEKDILSLVSSSKLSLTQKNIKMEPLVKESKIIKQTIININNIYSFDYSGSCFGNKTN